ncbi:hypothetical protein [Halorarum salinum]|uniref:Uncharacterized protein n=1 Tax=Halorarum salinum TaxID=2743089 RepID=A0A7D5QDC2_9EURY|nr:hypothetical protein [Halobaculum salinum]QLG61981.1 hypothetical protein HUG12_09710 [Halobaculum salinum]
MSALDFTDETFQVQKVNIAVFWLIITGLAIVGLLWMNTLGANSGNTALTSTSTMFALLWTASVIIEFAVYMFYRHRFWGDRENEIGAMDVSLLWFYLGFAAMVVVSTVGRLSVMQPMSLLSQAAERGALTDFQYLYMNAFVAPTIEENFFRIALPVFLIILFVGIAESLDIDWLGHPVVQVVAAVSISSLGFVVFHTLEESNPEFQLVAFVFGTVLAAVFVGDLVLNVFSSVTVVPALLVGIHLGNNVLYIGLRRTVDILLSGESGILLPVVGIDIGGHLILGMFVVGAVIAAQEMVSLVREWM